MELNLAKVLRDKHYLFLILLVVSFINPLNIFLMGTSMTFTFAVLLTYMTWIYMKWSDFLNIATTGSRPEYLLGLALILGNIARNMLSAESMSFGIFDMLVMLVGLYVIFFGLKATRFFAPLIAYSGVLLFGYQLEYSIEQVMVLQNFLAWLMHSLLRSLNVVSWLSGNIVMMIDRSGATHNLMIDGPCTGIKGMLAYGSLAALIVLDIKAPAAKKAIATALGLLGTFLVNVLRLSVIFLTVYFLGVELGLLLHTYLGYFLFTLWVVAFWSLAFSYLTPKSASADQAKS